MNDLLPYQGRWISDDAALRVCEKSRRIGMSWSEALDAVLYAASGKGNVYYQTFREDVTKGFLADCAAWIEDVETVTSEVEEILVKDEQGRASTAYRITCASGKEILGLSSNPHIFRSRGRPGDLAILDEAAFLPDLQASLTAATAFLTWGGKVHILSTHQSDSSPFARLCDEIRDGKSKDGSLHRVTFSDAIADGLYRRVCEVTEEEWSAEAEAEWEARIRAHYGDRAGEELDCHPASGYGCWLEWAQIRAAESEACPPERGFEDAAPEAAGYGVRWIGVDVARERDLWVAVVLDDRGGVLWTVDTVVGRGETFRAQRGVVAALIETWRPIRVAVDQTGMGEAFVESLQEAHGTVIEGVRFSAPVQLDLATALSERLQDRGLRIPDSEALRQNLRAVRREPGRTGGWRLVTERTREGQGETSHADRFWAYALACAVAADGHGPFEGQTVGRIEAPSLVAQAVRADYGAGVVRSLSAGALRGFAPRPRA